jgi:hypothetical protein
MKQKNRIMENTKQLAIWLNKQLPNSFIVNHLTRITMYANGPDSNRFALGFLLYGKNLPCKSLILKGNNLFVRIGLCVIVNHG